MAYEKNPDELGAVWRKEGKDFMTGTLEINGVKIPIIMFPSIKKDPSNRKPDWRILKSKPREEKPAVVPQDVDVESVPF